jgi:hypothetical protein
VIEDKIGGDKEEKNGKNKGKSDGGCCGISANRFYSAEFCIFDRFCELYR